MKTRLSFLLVGFACVASGCPSRGPVCGNNVCEAGETAACSDCGGPVCGDGTCEGNETAASCPGDCGGGPVCGDGFCDAGETVASCPGDCGGGPVCGDGFCDATEDTSCTDCTFEIGESVDTAITAADYLGFELGAAFGITEANIIGAFAVAKPANVYDFNDWCGAGCSTTWIGAYFGNDTGYMVVRGTAPSADYTDFLMVCEAPDGTLFANDDFNTMDCVNLGICDPGMAITGAGVWLCLFGAAPFATTNVDPYGPITISASAS